MDLSVLMPYFFLVSYVFLSSFQMNMNKVYQIKVRVRSNAATFLYILVMSFTAVFGFFAIAKFEVWGDGTMFLFALIAAIKAVLGNFALMLCIIYANLATMTIAQNAGALVIPALFGFLFLREAITPLRLLGIIFILAAFAVSFAGTNSKDAAARKSGLKGKLSCLLLFLMQGIGNVIHKGFTMSASASSNSTYLAWTNVFMVFMTIAILAFMSRGRWENYKKITEGIYYPAYIAVAVGAVVGCVGMVASLKAMEGLDMAIYSPLNSSLVIIFMTVSSRFIFKEKLTKYNYLSVALAIISVIVTSMA